MSPNHLALKRNLIPKHRNTALKPRAQINLSARKTHRGIKQRSSVLEHLIPSRTRRRPTKPQRERVDAQAQFAHSSAASSMMSLLAAARPTTTLTLTFRFTLRLVSAFALPLDPLRLAQLKHCKFEQRNTANPRASRTRYTRMSRMSVAQEPTCVGW